MRLVLPNTECYNGVSRAVAPSCPSRENHLHKFAVWKPSQSTRTNQTVKLKNECYFGSTAKMNHSYRDASLLLAFRQTCARRNDDKTWLASLQSQQRSSVKTTSDYQKSFAYISSSQNFSSSSKSFVSSFRTQTMPSDLSWTIRKQEYRSTNVQFKHSRKKPLQVYSSSQFEGLEPQSASQKPQQVCSAATTTLTATETAVETESDNEFFDLLSYDEYLKQKESPYSDYKRPVPIFVMLPLNTVSVDGHLHNTDRLMEALRELSIIGVEGVMVDIWWGIVEREGPQKYDWSGYKQLLNLVKSYGLKLQAVMSFHACGANVGDAVDIPLPGWIVAAASDDPHILYTDRHGFHNPECISLWADNIQLSCGRSPLQCYADFMSSFRDAMGDDLGQHATISDVCIGCGPCGELRYPAYPENRRVANGSQWRFPGVGEFQCYDRHALANLQDAAKKFGREEWGRQGPHDSGGYNDWPESTGFFRSNYGSWESDYGHFFLSWYAQNLCDHGDRMLEIGRQQFGEMGIQLSLKLAGVHWWYNSKSHASELTAGYYNVRSSRCHGYDLIAQVCAKYNARLNFTCIEMQDCDHPEKAMCSPEGLLYQVRLTAAKYNVLVSGENALCRFDDAAYDRIIANCAGGNDGQLPPLAEFTFLRLFPELFNEHNKQKFSRFVQAMREMTGNWMSQDGLQNFDDLLEFDVKKDPKDNGGYFKYKFRE